MSRISIDVTPEEHQKLKALAALQGKSMKEFVLTRVLHQEKNTAEEQALTELEGLLDQRIQRAAREGISTRSAEDIFGAIIAEG